MTAIRQTPITRPFAIPFESVEPVITPQGHRIRPLIDGRQEGGNVPGFDFAVGGLDVPPGAIANAHWHPETDVAVLVWSCGEEGALTLYGPQLEYQVRQLAGQWLPIQKGWAHTVINLSLGAPVRAYEIRGNDTVLVDNPLLQHLQPLANLHGTELLIAEHGREEYQRFLARQVERALAAQAEVDGDEPAQRQAG